MVFRLFEVRNLFGIPPEFLRAVVAAAEEFIYGFGHLLGIAVVLLLRQGHAADRRLSIEPTCPKPGYSTGVLLLSDRYLSAFGAPHWENDVRIPSL